MSYAINRLAPTTPSGSVLASLAAHGLLCGAVVAIMSVTGVGPLAPPATMDLTYEMLEAPPEPVTEIRRSARVVEPEAVQPKVVPATSVARELQDTTSDVIGTQAAAPIPASAGTGGASGAEAVPYYKIKPKYPRAALVSGDEGWVMLKVDVNETGEVENVRVIDGVKRNLFQDEARRAVEKWKYRPFLDPSGAPTRKPDHLVRVDFKLQDA